MEEKRSQESPQGSHNLGRCAPRRVAPSCTFRTVYYFPSFLYIPKRTESTFMEFLESVYLPYHIPTPFQSSGAFRKVCFMCSSGVIV
jgi:hypothetical protein